MRLNLFQFSVRETQMGQSRCSKNFQRERAAEKNLARELVEEESSEVGDARLLIDEAKGNVGDLTGAPDHVVEDQVRQDHQRVLPMRIAD